MLKDEEARGEAHDEEVFKTEMDLEDVQPGLKKPKYYNRVRTDVEWTKHNEAKFTKENPPPKVVLGYKFNIFYPDLETRNKAPTYQRIPTENPDLEIIVFKASPPYCDIAFKITHYEWEFSQRKGFKCDFSNGILHLHFNFKRYTYRR